MRSIVLVTGATGFLGAELVRQLLERGFYVRAIKRPNAQVPACFIGKDIEWVEADLMDYFSLEDAIYGVDKVYHCAALVSFNPFDKDKMLLVNAQGTRHIVNICLEKKITKLLHVSSVATLGDSNSNQPISENDIWKTYVKQQNYAVSKYEAEMEVWRGIAEGLHAVIVNPSVIIGKGCETNQSIFNLIKNGIRFYPTGSCGFVDIEDVAISMIILMEGHWHSERYIINAENISYKKLLTQVTTLLGMEPPTIKLQLWVLRLVGCFSAFATALTGKTIGLSKSIAQLASKDQAYASDKLKKALSFQFKPIEQSLAEMCQALKESLHE